MEYTTQNGMEYVKLNNYADNIIIVVKQLNSGLLIY